MIVTHVEEVLVRLPLAFSSVTANADMTAAQEGDGLLRYDWRTDLTDKAAALRSWSGVRNGDVWPIKELIPICNTDIVL